MVINSVMTGIRLNYI